MKNQGPLTPLKHHLANLTLLSEVSVQPPHRALTYKGRSNAYRPPNTVIGY